MTSEPFDIEWASSALRRGDFRVVYEIEDHHQVVTVLAIDHRSDNYRPR